MELVHILIIDGSLVNHNPHKKYSGTKYNDWDLSLRDVFRVHNILVMFKNVIIKSYMDCLCLGMEVFSQRRI